MKRLTVLLALSVPLTVTTARPTRAAPMTVPIQALIQNAAGMPVDGTRSVMFLLYAAEDDSVPFWWETQTLNIEKGQVATMLGKVTPIPLPFTGSAWLGIRVGGDPEMTPRLTIGAVPFALGLPNVFTTAAGHVGIGTLQPKYALDILDDQAVTRLTSTNTMQGSVIELRNTSDNISETVGAINFVNHFGTYAGQVAYVEDMANAELTFKVAGAERMSVDSQGRLSLGVLMPNATIDVKDPTSTSTMRLLSTALGGSSIELRSDAMPISRIGSMDFTWKGTGYGRIAYPMVGNSNDGLAFTAGMAERARLTASGLLGLGTTDPQYPLDIVSAGQGAVRVQTQNSGYGSVLELRNNSPTQSMVGAVNFVTREAAYAGQVGYWTSNAMSLKTNGADRVWIDSIGRVGIALSAPSYPLDVQGDINSRGAVRAYGVALTSDAKYKANVSGIVNGLEAVQALRGVTFHWNRSAYPEKGFPEGQQLGFVAQEVEKVLPQVVQTDGDGSKSVAYQNIVPVLVEAIKAQQKEIEEKDAALRAVQARLDRLERLIGSVDR